jgi:hypothetical protein
MTLPSPALGAGQAGAPENAVPVAAAAGTELLPDRAGDERLTADRAHHAAPPPVRCAWRRRQARTLQVPPQYQWLTRLGQNSRPHSSQRPIAPHILYWLVTYGTVTRNLRERKLLVSNLDGCI